MEKAWVAVASAEHVAIGRAAGFMQVCHGKAAPLRRIAAGERVVYYAPSTEFRGGAPCRSFVALGRVLAGAPYQVEMAPGFVPWRRDVDWAEAAAAPIAPLLERMEWTAGKRSWAFPLRFGLFPISLADMAVIADAMGVARTLPNR